MSDSQQEFILAHHILLGTLCGALKALKPEIIEGLRLSLDEKAGAAEQAGQTEIAAATRRALSLVPLVTDEDYTVNKI